jgi:hypothetical protein
MRSVTITELLYLGGWAAVPCDGLTIHTHGPADSYNKTQPTYAILLMINLYPGYVILRLTFCAANVTASDLRPYKSQIFLSVGVCGWSDLYVTKSQV